MSYEHVEDINYGKTYEIALDFKLKFFKLKIMFRIGRYRIVRKDDFQTAKMNAIRNLNLLRINALFF